MLVTPVLDSDLDTPSYLDPERQLALTRDAMRWFWDRYAPDADRSDPRLAPLRGADFGRLPRTVFVSVSSDVLWSEGERYLEELSRAGVPFRHREYPGQMHGFFQLYDVMDAAADAASWIGRRLIDIANDHPEHASERGASA